MKSLGNVVILGDSYSTFEGCIPDEYACYYLKEAEEPSRVLPGVEATWWHPLMRETGSKLLFNCSFSGSTICDTGYNAVYRPTTSFVGRMKTHLMTGTFAGKPIDTLLVFGGTNDTWAGSPLGEIQREGWSADDLRCVLPAIFCLFTTLRKTCPQTRILAILNTELKPAVEDGIRTACAENGIEVIPLHDIQKLSGHPNVEGMKQIKDQILAYLETHA